MSWDPLTDADATRSELRKALRQARSKNRDLEAELSETNEGMVALTLELERAKERYQTIFEESTDGILLIDPERDIIFEANPRVCEMLGYDKETLVTLSPADIFPSAGHEIDSFAEAVVHGWAEGYTCRTNDGRNVEVDISASMVTLDDKSLLLASLRDVTERNRRNQRLQVLTRIFRHNLRNEGNVIQGHADLLYDELSGSAREESVRTIRQKIDNILATSSKVRRVQSVLERERRDGIPLDRLLAEQRAWLKETYPSARVTVQSPAPDGTVNRNVTIVLREALENVAEHTDGKATVSISVEPEKERVRIEIADDGSGIPEPELEALRSGGETPLAHTSGIGLWSMYWVIDSIGGELTFESNEQSGTTVSMGVPLGET